MMMKNLRVFLVLLLLPCSCVSQKAVSNNTREESIKLEQTIIDKFQPLSTNEGKEGTGNVSRIKQMKVNYTATLLFQYLPTYTKY